MASHETSLTPTLEPDDEPTRRDVILIAASGFAAIGAAAALWPLLDQMNPDQSALSLSSTEVDISHVETGQAITVVWRGKPIFIRHRTDQEIAQAKDVEGRRSTRPARAERQSSRECTGQRRQSRRQGPRALAGDDRHLHPSRLHPQGPGGRRL